MHPQAILFSRVYITGGRSQDFLEQDQPVDQPTRWVAFVLITIKSLSIALCMYVLRTCSFLASRLVIEKWSLAIVFLALRSTCLLVWCVR